MGRQVQRADSAIARTKRALSIRARLMILAIIAIVPLVLERVHNEQFDRSQRVEAAYQQALGLARRAAAVQTDVIVSTRAFLTVLAGTHVVANPADPSCGPLLKNIAEPEPWIRILSVANSDGRIVCSSRPDAVGLDISQRPHFINPIKTGTFAVGDYFMGTRDRTPFIVASLPQRRADGSIESVVLATLDLNWIGQIASALAVRHGSIMLLVDGNGTVLAHEPQPAEWVGRKLGDHPLIKDLLTQREGVVTAASLDGIRRIFALCRIARHQCACRDRFRRERSAIPREFRDVARLHRTRLCDLPRAAQHLVRRGPPAGAPDPRAGGSRRSHRPRRGQDARRQPADAGRIHSARGRARRHDRQAGGARTGTARHQHAIARTGAARFADRAGQPPHLQRPSVHRMETRRSNVGSRFRR